MVRESCVSATPDFLPNNTNALHVSINNCTSEHTSYNTFKFHQSKRKLQLIILKRG